MLAIPQRSSFPRRESFVAAAANALGEMQLAYDQLPVLAEPPDWAAYGHGTKVFHIALPLEIAIFPQGAYHALNSLMVQMIERRKSIVRMARVERAGLWQVWVETEG